MVKYDLDRIKNYNSATSEYLYDKVTSNLFDSIEHDYLNDNWEWNYNRELYQKIIDNWIPISQTIKEKKVQKEKDSVIPIISW